MPKASPKSKKKGANRNVPSKPFPNGQVLEDDANKQWKIGSFICQVSPQEMYSVQEADASGAKYPYILKIQLDDKSYFNVDFAKQENVEDFKNQKGLKTFGMPAFYGSGSHERDGEQYHFIIMDKFGTDLMKIFDEHNRHFPTTTVFKIAIQILDVLEYLHELGYVHADINASNVAMGITKDTQNKQVYLVEFVSTTKSSEENEYIPDFKKSHCATSEYMSRDAHNGVLTKRGDLESLAYNLIQWLGCILPWEDIDELSAIQKLKEEYMSSIFKFIKACFDKRSPPGPIVDFLNYLSTLEYNSTPDYKNIRKIFLSGLDSGDALGKPLQFTLPEKSPTKKSPTKRKNNDVPKSPPKKRQAKKQAAKEESEGEKENLDDDHVESDQEETSSDANAKKRKKSPKKKQAKKQVANDISEDERENVDDDVFNYSDKEESSTNTNLERKKPPKKKQTKKKIAKDDSENEDENEEASNIPMVKSKGRKKTGNQKKTGHQINKNGNLDNDDKVDIESNQDQDSDNNSEIPEESDNLKGKSKSFKNKKVPNTGTEEELNGNGYNISDTEEISKEDDEIVEEKRKTDKKKTTKRSKKAPEENQIRVVAESSTRTRGRQVNYKEDSDEESKPSRKKSKNPKGSHVTGDTSDADSKNVKNSRKPSKKKQIDAESVISSTSDEPPKRARKKRTADVEENI